jgi:predicted DNA-binding transcriptional regulator YafY
MARSDRLLRLLDLLRRHRRPVAGAILAAEIGVSLRSLYRDIATLQAQGADIRGEAGLGYVLKPGFMLPPLMLSDREIESVVLGARWVAQHGDADLAEAARGALAKILAVVPEELRALADVPALLVGPSSIQDVGERELPVIRDAIRRERKLRLDYVDGQGAGTTRLVWPIALSYFDRARVVVAWCELRWAFRHFRTDRMEKVTSIEQRYPRRRADLLADWRRLEGVPDS